MKTITALLISVLGSLALAQATPPTVSFNVQTGAQKCVPVNGAISCNTQMAKAANLTYQLTCSTSYSCDSGPQNFEITIDDQKFEPNVRVYFDGSNYTLTGYFGDSAQLNNNLSYQMTGNFQLVGPLTFSGKQILVTRNALETDSYSPVVIISPASN